MKTDLVNSFGDFYPRSPCGERRSLLCYMIHLVLYFYPRSPCGERLLGNVVAGLPTLNFYPRSPCGERPIQPTKKQENVLFLSTLSLRRATAKVHKTVGHFCAYETNFMGIASSC